MVTRTKVTIYQSQIEQTWWRGSVYWNVRDTAEIHLELAQQFAPVRTGHLKNTMDKVMTPKGRLQWRYTIRANADYAEYTLRPTGPVIWPTKSVFLWVRPAPYSRYKQFTPRMSVAGYWSENWLDNATTPTFIAQNLL